MSERFPKWQLHRGAAAEKPVHGEGDNPGDGENAHHAGNGGQGYGERGVALGEVGDDVRSGAAWAGGENHQPDGQLAGQAESEGEREGDERQQDKLAGQADDFRFGRENNAAEIRRHQTQPHAEEHGKEGQRQSHFFEQLGWHPVKLPQRLRGVDAGTGRG